MRYHDYEGDAEALVQSQLDELERTEGVRVIRAVESGSHSKACSLIL